MSDQELVRTNTELEKVAQTKLLDLLGRHKRNIEAVLGKALDPKRFAWLVVNSVRQTPALLQCSPASVLNSVMLATQMGIEIRRDSAYLIPFGAECTLLIDYKSKLDLARRGGKVGGIQALAVRERDEFDCWTNESGFHLHHRTADKGRILSAEERGHLIGVYAYAQLTGGGMQWRAPMSLDEIERIRKRSRAGAKELTIADIRKAAEWTADGTQQEWQTWGYRDKRRVPWVTDFEAMALKTVLHSLCKSLPLDPMGQLSQEVDEGLETGRQPNPLADAVDIDPADMQPMIETLPKEEMPAVAEKRIEQERAKSAKGSAAPPPKAGTLSAINGYRTKLGDDAWFEVMGAAGYESTAQIPTEKQAALVSQLMLEREQGI